MSREKVTKILVGVGAFIGTLLVCLAFIVFLGWALVELVNFVFNTNFTTWQGMAFLVALRIVAGVVAAPFRKEDAK